MAQKLERVSQNGELLAEKSLRGENDMLLAQYSKGLGENDEFLLQKIDRSKDKMINYWRKNRKVKGKRRATAPQFKRSKITWPIQK